MTDFIDQIDSFGPGVEFDHVGLAVASLDSLPVQPHSYVDAIQKVTVAFLSIHGVRTEAVQPGNGQSPVTERLRQGTKLSHLYFRVPDIDAAIREGRSKGLMPISRPVPAVACGGRRNDWLFCPVLRLFELVESSLTEGASKS